MENTNNIFKVVHFLYKKPGYRDASYKKIQKYLKDISKEDIKTARKLITQEGFDTLLNNFIHKDLEKGENYWVGTSEEGCKLLSEEYIPISRVIKDYNKALTSPNTLFISDLHLPYSDIRALNFCKKLYNKYDIQEVVFMGDIVDNHATSYYEKHPEANGIEGELKLIKQDTQEWYKAFPKATVLIGNHDKLPLRKAKSANISERWFRDYNEVFETPNWTFVQHYETTNYIATHGDMKGKSPERKALLWMNNVVQSHYHTESYIKYLTEDIWCMQLGCMVNKKSWAFDYANGNSKDFILSCGVLYEGTPIIETLK